MTETKQTMPYKLFCLNHLNFCHLILLALRLHFVPCFGFAAHALKTVRVSDLSLHFTKGKANRL
jgi:hypothetical protein